MNLLAIDIGNTNITLGVFNGEPSSLQMTTSWRLHTNPVATADEYGANILQLLRHSTLQAKNMDAMMISNVVPSLTPVFQELAKKYFNLKALIIGKEVIAPIKNLYSNPEEVGADRLVNAVAARARFGSPCIVVDFGTATTFDCVTAKGEYAGGVIVPGPLLAAESLSLHTAQLPKVQMQKPKRVVGKNTTESIQSGLYFGYVALVDGMIFRLRKELGQKSMVIATGGLASLLAQDSKYISVKNIVPDLTLDGIRIIFENDMKNHI